MSTPSYHDQSTQDNRSDDLGFVIPADPDAELAVLGAILIQNDTMDQLDHLRPEHFFDSLNRRIFQRMREFWQNGEPIDYAMLSSRDYDMKPVLMNAMALPYPPIFGLHYAKIVIDLARKRNLLTFAENLGGMALNGRGPDEIIAYAETELAKQQDSGAPNLYDRWDEQLLTAAQMAEAEASERTYIVADVLRDGSLSIFYGKPGEFKSMLLMDLALCVGAGLPWLAPLPVEGNTQAPINTRQARVLWMNYDQAGDDVKERLAAMARSYPDGALNVVALNQSEPVAVLMDDLQARRLGKWIAAQGFGLVVVDSLIDIRGARKLIEEEMGDLLRLWRIVAEESGAAVVLISHPTKGTDDLFGSQFIKAKLDHLYHVTRKGDWAEVQSEKQRSYGTTDKLRARWTFQHKPGTRTLERGRFWGDSTGAERGENVTTQDECLNVLMGLPGRPLTPDEILELVNDRRNETDDEPRSTPAIRRALDRLQQNHRNVGKLENPIRFHYGEIVTP